MASRPSSGAAEGWLLALALDRLTVAAHDVGVAPIARRQALAACAVADLVPGCSPGSQTTTPPSWTAISRRSTSSTCGPTASTFEPISKDGSVGYLTVPWSIGGIGRLITIDGQHRILGVHLEKKRITDEVSRIDREIHRANEAKKAKLEQDREALIGRMQRLKDEFVGIDIYVEPDGVKGQQMFVDVADNAKGISGAVRARLDTSRIANRTLSDIVTRWPPATSPPPATPVCAPTST
ncbi:hypothetical protein [Streptomyces sp. NPDC005231]|uniref:hypothetical protein n=1 Tax=Streptomyces sp. NPDC005231 TaxID=3157026 RepID=UPI00339E2A33